MSGAAALMPIRGLEPTTADVVSLSPGLTHHLVMREGELAPSSVEFVPGATEDHGALWIGGAFLRIARGPVSNRWSVVRDDRYGKRLSVASTVTAVTPWGTLLTVDQDDGVIEVEPAGGAIKKLPALGRHPRSSLAVVQLADGRVVVYSGSLFKFVADRPGSLESGALFVASFEGHRWLPITREAPLLKRVFKDQSDLLNRAQEAGRLAGGSIRPLTPILAHASFIRFGGQVFVDQTFTFEPSQALWPTDLYTVEGATLVLHRRGLTHTIANAPRDAIFSAPAIARGGRTLFLTVKQGTVSESHWPDGGIAAPRSAVIAVEGHVLGPILETS